MLEFEDSYKEDKRSSNDKEYFPHKKPSKKQSRNFACIFCHMKFAQKSHLSSHFLNNHKDIPEADNLISNKIHYCNYCDYRTINCHNLAYHQQSKHKNNHQKLMKKLHCSFCNYSTNNKGNMMLHSRRHTKVKLFDCQYCERSCNQKSNLDAHYLLKHRAEPDVEKLITSKVYKCELCEFKTLNKTKHRKHVAECCRVGFFGANLKFQVENYNN